MTLGLLILAVWFVLSVLVAFPLGRILRGLGREGEE